MAIVGVEVGHGDNGWTPAITDIPETDDEVSRRVAKVRNLRLGL